MERGKAFGEGLPGRVARGHFSCRKARWVTGCLTTLRIKLTDTSELPTSGKERRASRCEGARQRCRHVADARAALGHWWNSTESLPEGRTNEEEVRLIRSDPASTVPKPEDDLAKPHAQAVKPLG